MMAQLGIAGLEHRRSRLAGAASLALHGGAVWLLIALGGKHRAPSPRAVALTSIEVVNAAPMPPSPPPSPPPLRPARTAPAGRPAGSRVGAGVHGRREPVQRSQPIAPPAVQSLADLQIRYDDPTSFADHGSAKQADVTSGAGQSGIGTGLGDRLADGSPSVTIPEAPGAVSHARSPRPKHDYRNMRIVGASRFAGQTIKLQLSIDEHGRVRGVQVLQGVDRELDRKTATVVHTFEYEPALDDAGVAIPGTARWYFQIVEDDGESF